jgi:hypothetical protein
MNATGKSLVPFLALGALILIVGLILYQSGYRVSTSTSATPPPVAQRPNHQPGKHQRRLAAGETLPTDGQREPGKHQRRLAETQGGQTGTQESTGEVQSGHASGTGGRSLTVRPVTPGTEKIAVIAKGKAQSFTGAELEKLQQITVVSKRGLWAGWRMADVFKQLAITQGNEVILTSKSGKTLRLPWEQITSREPTLLLTYNTFGGLRLLSGKEVTQEEVKSMDPQTLRTITEQNALSLISFSNINEIKIEG